MSFRVATAPYTRRGFKPRRFAGESCAVIAVGLAVFIPGSVTGEPTWQVFQLTNGPSSDTFPSVSGTTYVWHQGAYDSVDKKIMMWTEGDPTPVEISDNFTAAGARIDQGRVLWASKSSTFADYEIRLWQAGVVTAITNNDSDDFARDIGGQGMLWSFQNWYLVLDDGLSRRQLADGVQVNHARVMNAWVVWEAQVANREIYLWNDGALTQITNNSYDDMKPETDGQTIVWYGTPGPNNSGSAVFRWKQSTGIMQITEDALFGWKPDVSGNVIVFAGWDGHDYEIFLRYFGVNYQITNNDYPDEEPNVDGNRVVWQALDTPSQKHIYYAILSGLDGGDPPGACCVGMTCSSATSAACANLGGSFLGEETMCNVDSCLEAVKPASSWSTFQHDAQRSGRTTAVLPQAPVLKWNFLLGSAFPDVSPAIAPDGTIYTHAADTQLVAVRPNGSLRWQKSLGGEGMYAPATSRADGNFYLPGQNFFGKHAAIDGTTLCGFPNLSRYAPAIGEDGSIFVSSGDGSANPWMLRKVSASCEVQWTYNGSDGVTSDVAIGPDGNIYVASRFMLLKLSAADGSLLWSFATAGLAGRPAITPDGTVILHVSPNVLSAIRPNGTVKWSLTLSGLRNVQSSSAPAIAADGTAYLSTKTTSNEPTLVAVSDGGTEIWRYTEHFNSGANGLSPVVDGNGIIVFPVEFGDLLGIWPSDGQLHWRIDLGTDYVNTSPAIAQDGTLLVTTNQGFLKAYGSGCPAPDPQAPPFTYRRVVQEGDVINGFSIGNLEDFAILDDGRVTFQAYVASIGASGVFTELVGGGFDSIVRGSFVGGKEIDSVSLPCFDNNGTRYLPSNLVGFGPGIFADDVLIAATHSAAGAVILLNAIDDWSYVDCNDNGQFLTLGGTGQTAPGALLVVDTVAETAVPLVEEGQTVDGFTVESFDAADRNGFGNDGVPVLQSELFASGSAVITPTAVVARAGDQIDGRTFSSVNSPRRIGDGTVFYLGTGSSRCLFSQSPEGIDAFERGGGDTVAGYSVLGIDSFAANDVRDVAYTAALVGAPGAFWNGQPIAIAGVTQIDGVNVAVLYPTYPGVSVNASSQVAFLAQRNGEPRAIFVATLDFSFDSDGDGDVDEVDSQAFMDCFEGSNGSVSGCDCLSTFDVSGNGALDCKDWGALSREWSGSGNPPDFAPCIKEGCCFVDGSCAVMSPTSCTASQGVRVESGGECGAGACPQSEACCFPNGSCEDWTLDHCTSIGGSPAGVSTYCGSWSCPEPEACCLYNGSCVSVIPAECAILGGNSQGTGTTCGMVACPTPPNAINWEPALTPTPWPNTNPLATTRSLRFTVAASGTATATPGYDAIKVTMVDLQHPDPRNLTQYPPANFSTFDTATHGTCSGATTSPNYNGHHCASDADCLGNNGAITTDDGTCSLPGPACTAIGETNPPTANGIGGCARWVGKPGTFYESQGPPLAGPYRASRLQCSPFYWDWESEPGGLVTVVGAEIVPSSEYNVQAYAASCKGNEDTCSNVSTPVTMYTRRKGDLDAPYQSPSPAPLTQADVLDISQAVASVKHTGPAHYRGQMQPNLPELNADANVLDIVEAVDSVKRTPYSFSGPCVCPSTVTCGGSCTDCTGLCVKSCLGGDNDGQPCINNTHCPGVCVGGPTSGAVCPSGVPGGVNCSTCSGVCSSVGTCRDKCGRCSP